LELFIALRHANVWSAAAGAFQSQHPVNAMLPIAIRVGVGIHRDPWEEGVPEG